MASRTVHDCDGCGKRDIISPKKIYFETGSRMDASGNGSESIGEDLDLCPDCLSWLIVLLLDRLNDWEKVGSLLQEIEVRRRKIKEGAIRPF
jgi:hypothetical protein